MKQIKSTVAVLVLLTLLIFSFCFPVCAAEQKSMIYLDDGSYIVTTIAVLPDDSSARATSSISGQKTSEYYNSSNEKVYSLTVIGSFSYNGISATAVDASYDYSIYQSGYSFVSGSARCTGASATASATFKQISASYSASVTLSCSANGTLS